MSVTRCSIQWAHACHAEFSPGPSARSVLLPSRNVAACPVVLGPSQGRHIPTRLPLLSRRSRRMPGPIPPQPTLRCTTPRPAAARPWPCRLQCPRTCPDLPRSHRRCPSRPRIIPIRGTQPPACLRTGSSSRPPPAPRPRPRRRSSQETQPSRGRTRWPRLQARPRPGRRRRRRRRRPSRRGCKPRSSARSRPPGRRKCRCGAPSPQNAE